MKAICIKKGEGHHKQCRRMTCVAKKTSDNSSSFALKRWTLANAKHDLTSRASRTDCYHSSN